MLMFQVLDTNVLQTSHAGHNHNRVCNVGVQAGQPLPLSAGSGWREMEFISLSLAADV